MKIKQEQIDSLTRLVILSEELQNTIDELQYSDFHNVALQKKLNQVNELIAPILNTFHIQMYAQFSNIADKKEAERKKKKAEKAYEDFVLIQKDFNTCLKTVASLHPDNVRYFKIILEMLSKLSESKISYVPSLIDALVNGEIKIETENGLSEI